MKKYIFMSLFTALVIVSVNLVFNSCDRQKDLTPPTISDADFLPADCDIYYLGDTILVHFICSDNVELGNYNIEIHNNFDHHTHGTSAVDCDEEGEEHEHEHEHEHEEDHDHEHEHVEGAWVYNQDFAIPRGTLCDTIRYRIPVPADVLPGDYHFMLRLTDRAGWQSIKSVPIHVIETE
ncbi:MAG: DUF4625 domain-containing protein [Paludibacteraceae bacterium]|nr:DUF4625 domain-containing protein [Paludibacteraceae bacterium]